MSIWRKYIDKVLDDGADEYDPKEPLALDKDAFLGIKSDVKAVEDMTEDDPVLDEIKTQFELTYQKTEDIARDIKEICDYLVKLNTTFTDTMKSFDDRIDVLEEKLDDIASDIAREMQQDKAKVDYLHKELDETKVQLKQSNTYVQELLSKLLTTVSAKKEEPPQLTEAQKYYQRKHSNGSKPLPLP